MKTNMKKMGKRLMGFMLSVLMVFGLLAGHQTALAAEVMPVAVKTIRISDNTGNPLTGQVTMNNTFRIDADFALPNNTVHAGDTTTVTLPDYVLFDNSVTEFDLKDQHNQVVAKAKRQGNKLIVTYNNYVENKSDITGSFYFAVRFNGTQYQAPGKYKLDFDVSGTKIEAGEVDYQGTNDLPKSGLAKFGQTKKNTKNTIEYYLGINRYGKDLPNAVVVDNLIVPADAAVSGKIVESTIRVRKGTWVYDAVKKSWDLQNAVFVTPQKIELSNENRTLRVELGHVQATEGYQILYDIKMDYDLLPGEVIKNNAIMTADSEPGAKAQFPVTYVDAGGQANGYNYGIEVHKVDGFNNAALPGAEFEVIRRANEERVGTIVTNEDGIGKIEGLLRTEYVLREIIAPSGYQLLFGEAAVVGEQDFGADNKAVITVENIKETQPIDAVIKAMKIFKNDDGSDRVLQAGEFTFDLKDEQGQVIDTKSNEADGSVTFDPLTFDQEGEFKYTVVEQNTGAANVIYDEEPKEITIKITKDQGSGELQAEVSSDLVTVEIENTYEIPKTEISITKKWDDAEDQDGKRPESIKVQLYADGLPQGPEEELSENTQWTKTWGGLPKEKNGRPIVYTVKEIATPDGYTAQTDDTDPTHIIITNSHQPEETTVEGEKTWDDADNQDGKRPESIRVNLLADGQVKETVEVKADAAGKWQYRFTGLPVYQNGAKITYTVSEQEVAGYTATVDGYNIKNTYRPEETTVEGEKTWDDAENQDGKRPESIRVNLLADGQVKETVEVKSDADGNWKYRFAGLPVYQNGRKITYTVSEQEVAGYTATVDGFNIKNTHRPEETTIEGEKTWDDADNQDGKRPESIRVNLLADGQVKETVEVKADADGNWKYRFAGLPVYQNGAKITYTVSEQEVAGYTATVDGYNIKNTYRPEETTVEGEKTWDDADNQDGKRPESIRVNLLADGQVKETAEVKADADGKWRYRFTGLPVYQNGVKITYTVSEQEVAGYTATVDGFNIKNTYRPGKISVTVTKKWDDKDDAEKLRPTEVVVKLLANGKETGKEVKLNAANKWSAAFTELDEMAAGKTIEYTVKEVAVKGYTTKISGSMKKGYVITNSHQPKGKRVPSTGDDSALLATLTMFAGTGAAAVLLLAMKKRKSAK